MVYMVEEYVNLIPPLSNAEYAHLKQSIKEWGGLLMPIILNQDNVVLDGHHRLKACKELGIPITYSTKDFMNRPLDELKFVVSVNLQRHLDEFQRGEIGLKMKIAHKKLLREHHFSFVRFSFDRKLGEFSLKCHLIAN
jgi:hypothetical protein